MAKYSFPKQWPRWAGTVSDLDDLAKEAVKLAGGGSLQIEVHRRGLGISVFETGDEMTQGLTRPDLPKIDRVAILVTRKKSQPQNISRIAISFVEKIPGVTLEVDGTDQERVTGTLATLSHRIEEGLQFPQSSETYGLFQIVGLGVFIVAAALSLVAVLKVYRAPDPTNEIVIALAVDVLVLGYALWLLTPLELMPPGGKPRLRRLWVTWVVPLIVAILGGGFVYVVTR